MGIQTSISKENTPYFYQPRPGRMVQVMPELHSNHAVIHSKGKNSGQVVYKTRNDYAVEILNLLVRASGPPAKLK